MCGIFGAIKLDGRSADSLASIVKKGTELLKHRGPDDYGLEVSGPICFGHARLSIIDIETGHQPMWSHNGDGFICYNGEVYNFQNIRESLRKSGYIFHSRSDTEVVLNSFLEWGADCVKRFRGMFAFAAVDLRRRKVLLARDRLGQKPLFYTIKDNTLFYSSELEALYKTIGPFKIDLESLDDYLYWQYIHAPRTIYKDVKMLKPAHYIELDLKTGRPEERRYWSLNFKEERSCSIEDWEQRLDQEIREAVKVRLVSDVPFGAFLSGGVDSSLVTWYMADILKDPVKTFSIGFKEGDYSELKYAEEVARLNKTEHRSEIVEADSFSLLPDLVSHYGQPFADSSAIPTYYVSRMARRSVKMVLSGDGGDESFAGYNSYESVMRGLDCGGRRLKVLGYYYYLKFRRFAGLSNIVDDAYQLHCNTSKHFSPSERRNLFNPRYREVVQDVNLNRKALMDIGDQPMISRLQHLDIMAYLPFDILTKVDIASMANSLEVRCPLLDHKLVETAATIPSELKLKEERIHKKLSYNKKYILKRVAKRLYPEHIIDRPKMGFGVPLKRWFAGRLNGELRRRLLGSEYLPIFFNMDEITSIIEEHSIERDRSTKLWNLLFLEEWMRGHPDSLEYHEA